MLLKENLQMRREDTKKIPLLRFFIFFLLKLALFLPFSSRNGTKQEEFEY